MCRCPDHQQQILTTYLRSIAFSLQNIDLQLAEIVFWRYIILI